MTCASGTTRQGRIDPAVVQGALGGLDTFFNPLEAMIDTRGTTARWTRRSVRLRRTAHGLRRHPGTRGAERTSTPGTSRCRTSSTQPTDATPQGPGQRAAGDIEKRPLRGLRPRSARGARRSPRRRSRRNGDPARTQKAPSATSRTCRAAAAVIRHGLRGGTGRRNGRTSARGRTAVSPTSRSTPHPTSEQGDGPDAREDERRRSAVDIPRELVRPEEG